MCAFVTVGVQVYVCMHVCVCFVVFVFPLGQREYWVSWVNVQGAMSELPWLLKQWLSAC